MNDEPGSASHPKVSIVVPVYKVEKYLRDCVESALAQTFTDFELILVDDGSPDKSGELCDELARLDSRIRVFHQENGGVTSARRLGVEKARGEWVIFLDSDDLLPKTALKDLIAEATDDTDWVQGKIRRFKGNGPLSAETRTDKVTSFDSFGFTERMLLHYLGPGHKLVRRRLFSPYVMGTSQEMRVGEDVLMNLKLLANKPRNVKEIDKAVYIHRDASVNSVTRLNIATENYVLRYAKLLFAEVRKISTRSNRERPLFALSQHLCGYISMLIGYGLPIKFPHRLATLMRRGAKSKPSYFAAYLCLRFNCLATARLLADIFSFLRRKKLDPKNKTLLK